ncbi:hypothetical protein ACFWF9_30725 [Streptomyces roseolus]|uniref:hypothetical protein n=1 Tax=Streptomyces roseolus TaxID=67358 RepID=UPI003650A466
MSLPGRTARFTLDPDFTVGRVGSRLFGSFVEYLGRCVPTGAYEPGHPAADAEGLRAAPAAPDRVVPHAMAGTELADGVLKAALEPMSRNVVRSA